MTARWRHSASLLLLLAVAALPGCGPTPDSGASGGAAGGAGVAQIEGSVFYRERILLPPEALVEVQLQDISRPDAMATVMASVLLTPQGGPPYPFRIEYEPSAIDQGKRYGLRATISVGEALMFSSNEYIDPFTGEPVAVMLERVPEPVRHTEPEPPP